MSHADGLRIRTAQAQDVASIQRLYRELDRLHVARVPALFLPVAGDLRSDAEVVAGFDADDRTTLVAEIDGEVLGFAALIEQLRPDLPLYRSRRFGLLDNLCVAGEARGRGIGRALLDASRRWFAARGIDTLQVKVFRANAEAEAFYRAAGFKVLNLTLQAATTSETDARSRSEATEHGHPTIHGDRHSGNCYKLKLVLALLGRPCTWVEVDVLSGATRSEAFRRLNPNGKVPVLELPDGRTLAESNAILNFLAAGSDLLPRDPFALAKVQQWQCFEQYSHEPYIAVARFIRRYLGLPEARQAEYEAKQAGGHAALRVMEQQLAQTPFLTGSAPTTADIALYAYTHVAPEGGFELDAYPAIRAWLERVEALPGYVPMG